MTQDERDAWLAQYNQAKADERTAMHADKPPYLCLSENFELVGFTGEMAFGELIGQMPNMSLTGGDGGRDFWVALLFSVDVKCAANPGHLLHKEGHRFCDIYVLAGYDETTKRATCLGWEWGKNLARAPVGQFDRKQSVPSHYIAAGKLRPIEELTARVLRFKPA